MKNLILLIVMVFTLLAGCGTSRSAESVHNTISSEEDTEVTSAEESQYKPNEDRGSQTAEDGSYTYRTEEIYCDNNGKKIYGVAYIPERDEKVPVILFSHELGTSHSTGEGYAEYFASRGIAYYTFDFCGGSIGKNKSDGVSTEMSVLTEAADLSAVIDAAKTWNFVDSDRIILQGGSQGGMVASVTASQRPDDVAALIPMYPAYIIPDQLHEDFASLDAVPEKFRYIDWIDVGKIYAEDMWNYDVYGEIAKYKGPVLLLHGDRDYTVPMSYSERAEEAYDNAELHVISGGGHEFFGDAFHQACEVIDDWLAGHGFYEISDQNAEENAMKIKVSDGSTEIIVDLYDSPLSRSLVDQLPLSLELTDYAGNEKYVKTPRKLETDADYEKECPAGSLGYFAPWNNLCFFFGEAPAYPGQYLIGRCEDDPSEMEELTGTVRIELAE